MPKAKKSKNSKKNKVKSIKSKPVEEKKEEMNVEKKEEKIDDNTENKDKLVENNSFLTYLLIGLIIIVIVVLVYYFFTGGPKTPLPIVKAPQKCEDGTLYSECSSNGLMYCDNGELIENIEKCGCPSGEINANGICKLESELLPNTNKTCNELVPYYLSVRFSKEDRATELVESNDKLSDNTKLLNPKDKQCFSNVITNNSENNSSASEIICYAQALIIPSIINNSYNTDNSSLNVTNNSVPAPRSYRISYTFQMDKINCTNLTSFALGTVKNCKIIASDCSWNFSNALKV